MANYKVIQGHTDAGYQGSVPTNLTFNVGEIFEGREKDGVVYTTIDKTMPEDVWSGKMVGASFFSIPLTKVQEEKSTAPNTEKWFLIIGLTLAAWGLIYWSQKQK